MSKKIILIAIASVFILGLGYWIFHNTNPEQAEKEAITINVYFNNTNLNPNAEDCSKVYLLIRTVPKTLGVGKAALEELFKGPTEGEKSQGYTSWFSEKTKDILKSIKIENNTAYVDLKDIRQIIPNVSASCGSAEFLAEIEATLKQFDSVARVIIAIDGNPSTFYEWIQIGCSEENDFCDETPFKKPVADDEEAKQIITNRAKEAISAIKDKDALKLSNLVHPDKGVRFSPYSHVDLEKNIVFSPAQASAFFQDKKAYLWGVYDGSGEPINLTPSEYYNKFIYDADFSSAPEIGYNRIIGTGNIINNVFESYPNAIIVEYHFSGFDPQYEGMDWKSLELAFEKKDATWYLVGIIHGQWTI